MLKILYAAASLLLFLIALSFMAINSGDVAIDYYFGRLDLPLSLLLVITLAVGAACGLLAGLGYALRQKREIGRLRRAQRLAEEELKNLRALPLKDVG